MINRLLLINYEYPPIGAGAATATAHLAAALVKKGVDVHVVTSSFKQNRGVASESGITVHRIPSLRRFADHSSIVEMAAFCLSAICALPSIVKKDRPDAAIVFFAFPCGPLGLLLRILFGTPYVVSLRGGDVPGAEPSLRLFHLVLTPLRRLVYRKSIAVVANSEGLKKLAMEADPGITIHVIPNGVDTDFYKPDPSKKTPGAFVFLFVGRFQHQKNVGVLIDAFAICRKQNPNVRLVLCGDGPLRKELEQRVKDAGVAPDVTWYGWRIRDEVRELYQSADCFVNPSLYEGMANTVLEAMASGLPVLAGNCIGNNDIITDEVNGMLFDPQSVMDLAGIMSRLPQDRLQAQAMGNAGRETSVATYSWNAVADGYMKLM